MDSKNRTKSPHPHSQACDMLSGMRSPCPAGLFILIQSCPQSSLLTSQSLQEARPAQASTASSGCFLALCGSSPGSLPVGPVEGQLSASHPAFPLQVLPR